MAKKKKKLLIIDSHALIHRAFHALPPLNTKDGAPVNAVYGFLLILIRALKDIRPDYVAVAFDSKGKTFRHKVYPQYKGTRKETPDELISQFPLVREVVDAFGFPAYAVSQYEADDLIGTICTQFDNAGDVQTIILTGDMDLLQLVDSNTCVLKLHKGVKDTVLFDEKQVEETMGFAPAYVTDFKGLRGDPSDNLPGVKGIGEKGATELIQKYQTIENIYTHIDELQGRVHKALDGKKEEALLSKQLSTIATDAPIEFNIEDAEVGQYDQDAIQQLFQRFAFKSLLGQLQDLPGFQKQSTLFSSASDATQDPIEQKRDDQRYTLVPCDETETKKHAGWLATQLAQQSIFAFDTETTGLDPLHDSLVGISFSWKAGEAYYVSCGDAIPPALKKVFEDPSIHKTGHNIKFDAEVLRHAGVDIQGLAYDTMLASYILNSSTRSHGLDSLAFVECGYHMQPIEELIGKGKNQISMKDVPVEKVSWYACEDADFTWRLYEKFMPMLRQQHLEELLTTIEIPTLRVLIEMEEAGVKIDTPFLKKMSARLHKRLQILEKEIHVLAGIEFNIASNIQLKEILFDRLNISTKHIKRTKTGFSTAASELEKLRGVHPIVDKLFEFRELSKLTSTYIDTLPKLVHPESGRIHTSFNQTIAATGRLSSTDPNLQNIPIRTELGREIRKAFIPEKGKKLLTLDYSQIELRVVAHLANDKVMLEAFKRGEDIHARTAAELNDVPLKKVTDDMRRAAKAINFGVLYGMGVSGIVRDSKVSREEAHLFLEKYFSVHRGIYHYIEEIKTQSAKDGYAQSLFGRKRWLPELQSRNPMLKAAAERAAVNMPVQGTAADIMKLAMIAVYDAIKKGDVDALMILQVHDELVFEVDEKRVASEAKKIKEIMEQVYTLQVPMTVSAKTGDNWEELRTIT